jgi:carbamoyl-phosphate synthase large subunit
LRTGEEVSDYAASVTDLKSILIIGAGPIVIGQACEFDYSGAQACKALREEGYQGHPGEFQSGHHHDRPGMADATYIEPIDLADRRAHHRRNAPMRCCRPWAARRRSTVRSTSRARRAGEVRRGNDRRFQGSDRQGRGSRQVREGDDRIGLATAARSGIAHSWKKPAGARIPSAFPAIIRPSFTMGGSGGGIAYNKEEFDEICRRGLEAVSPTTELLIEESLLGWKEYEMEVVRDRRTTASSSAPSKTSIRWASTPAIPSPSRRRRR